MFLSIYLEVSIELINQTIILLFSYRQYSAKIVAYGLIHCLTDDRIFDYDPEKII